MRKRITAPAGFPGGLLRHLPFLLLGLAMAGDCPRAQARGAAPSPNTLDLRLWAGERFSSNPRFLPEGDAPEGDYFSDMRANFSMSRKTERTDWSLRYNPFYFRYRENSQLDTSNHTFNYDGRYAVSRRWRVILAEHFAYSRDPLHVATVEGGYDPVITGEAKKWRNFADAETETDLSRSLTLQTGVSGRVDRFQDPTLTDSETWAGRVGLLKHLGRTQGILTTYTYARFLLSGMDAAGEELPYVVSHGLELAWSYTAPGHGEVHVTAGASQVTREGERQDLFTGGVTFHQPFRHTDLTAGYRQNLSADVGVAAVNVSQNSHAGFSARMGRATTLAIIGNYGSRKSVLEGGAQVDLTYAGALLRGAVAVSEWLSVAAEASRRKQRDAFSTRGDVNVDSYFIGVIFKVI